MAECTVAIPTFNDDPRLFARTLDLAIEVAAGRPVVVVDMSTDDGVRGVCAERGDAVTYDFFPQSGGVSHSRNRCVEIAPTRHVAFLDSDAFPEPAWLERLGARLDDRDVAVVGCRILGEWERPPGRLMQTVTAADWLSLLDLGDEPLTVPRIIGTSYAIDRERVKTPPFDERLGRKPGWPLAMEENQLCDDARELGWRVMYEPAAVVRHWIPASRATMRWMWGRAHTAGRETRSGGRYEPLPRPPLGPRDRLFQALVAAPFFAGMVRRPTTRDA